MSGRALPSAIRLRGALALLGAALGLFACAHDASIDRADHAATHDAGTDAIGFDLAQPPDDPGAACLAAAETHSSVGCEYYAIEMDAPYSADNGCFVAFVANTSDRPAHLSAEFAGEPIDLPAHVKYPRGSGLSLTYDDFDGAAGLAPGDVAILFLAGVPGGGTHVPGDNKPVACPVPPAFTSLTQLHGTGIAHAFHIRTDVPVVAYQMLPYGGGDAAVTGASLLLPTSAWDTNYIAVDAYTTAGSTSLDVVAWQDDTTVTILPNTTIKPGGGLPGADKGVSTDYHLAHRGDVLQITQDAELTGSPIESDKPIGLFAGQPCLTVPAGVPFCDHAEQQIPPIRALGHEYAAVSHRPRTPNQEDPPWRLIGAVDGTALQFDPPVKGAPKTLNLGDVVELHTQGQPFVVRSQDADHPFLVNAYMTGASTVAVGGFDGYGDADFVRIVPSAQYLSKYVFFTDPTYPETNLVVTRKKRDDGTFADVTLDCAGVLGDWTALGEGYQWTRIDLVRHDFRGQHGCDNGRHEMKSDATFGLWVWGWGSNETKRFTGYVSYGYPAGENLAALNTVVVPARPR
ncbi:MAG: hypothetical protein NVSMB47_03400 [Polyangiales bacterium]